MVATNSMSRLAWCPHFDGAIVIVVVTVSLCVLEASKIYMYCIRLRYVVSR